MTILFLLRIALIIFIIALLFAFHLCAQWPHNPPRLSRHFQILQPSADFCRALNSHVESSKSRPPVHDEHHWPANHKDTAIRTIQALSDFTSCYVEHGTEDFARVTLRGRRARCSTTINRLFELAITTEGYVALHHYVDKEQSSDRRIELENCYESLGRVAEGNKDICLRRFFKDPKLLPTAKCTNRWEFKLAVLHHLASCDLRSSELQLCAARQILHVIEDFRGCQVESDDVAALREHQRRDDVKFQPFSIFAVGRYFRRPHSSKFSNRLSGCLAKKTRVSKRHGHDDHGHDDDDSDNDDEEARAKVTTIVLTTIFAILGVLTSICVVLQVVRRYKRRPEPVAAPWESHRTSVQEANRDVFTDASIPEEEEENYDGAPNTASSDYTHTQRWYDRIFKKLEKNTTTQENAQTQEKRRKLKRRTPPPPEDIENVFVMPPAPNSRVVRKKVPSFRMPLRPINDNLSEDSRGHRISSTGSVHAEKVGNAGVGKSIRLSGGKRQRL